MFAHNKRLQYTVRVSETNPGLANLMLEQFGGPQGELAAACRYFSQDLAEEDPGRRDMLIDIATEELSHLEVIGTIVAMLNRGAKARLAEAALAEAELYRAISGGGNDSHVTQVLYGGGPAFTNSAGVPWTAACVDTIGDPSCDLRSNIAAEARAKIVYERLINLTDDPGVKEALGFLMTREISHQQSFEKALYSMQPNFPPGKLPGQREFANVYYNMSTGEGDARGPWNADARFDFREGAPAVDGGSGLPEGLAIGVAFGGDPANARALVTGIAIQDVPEGLVVALALRAAGLSRGASGLLGAASGLVEPVAAVAAALAVVASASWLPWGMALAAGAMLYAVSHHAIPGAHGQGHGRAATVGVVFGYVLMRVLDTALAP